MKHNHYKNKKGQLKILSRQLKKLLQSTEHVPKKKIDILIFKIKALLNELKSVVHFKELRKALGIAAFIFGLSVLNPAIAQTFDSPQVNPFGLSATSYFSSPTNADLDGDGDLDILISEYGGNMKYFENTGSATSPQFGTPQTNPFGFTPSSYVSFPVLIDLDDDGDQDLFTGEYAYGNIYFYENTGTATSPQFGTPQTNHYGLTPTYYFSNLAFADLDNDGDKDLIVGEYYGNFQYFENTGTANAPQFAAPQQNPFGLSPILENAFPAFTDLDQDGDQDLLAGEYYGNLQYFENTGTINSPQFAPPQQNPFGLSGSLYIAIPTFADIDLDGDADLFVGEAYGNTKFFENISPLLGTEIDTALCGGDTLLIGDEVYTEAGMFTQVVTGSMGQDSTLNINIEYLGDAYEVKIDTTVCENGAIILGDEVYDSPGEYIQELESIAGCDSTILITIGLSGAGSMTEIDTSICDLSEGLTFGNETYFTPGEYQQIHQGSEGCDSTVKINITLDEDVETTEINETICDGVPVIIGGVIYDQEGTYFQIIDREEGCDSLFIINLARDDIPETNIDTVMCENGSIVLGGITYDAPGDYVQTITTQSGCDSTVLIHLETKICNIDDCEEALLDLKRHPTLHICPGQPNPYITAMQAVCEFEYYNVTVVSKIGHPVFKSTTPGAFWDGHTNSVSPFDLYYYVLYYRLPGGELKKITGIIVLKC